MAKAQLSPGMQIDGFLIEERLHRGGMADIWRVSRADFDVPIVMKAPFLDKKGELSLLVGFEVEQMIMGELQGRHVPRLLASGDFAVQPYFIMEYFDTASLDKRIRGVKPSIEQTIAYATAIADALSDLHQQHVLHLDLKPANVLFRPNGDAVLVDFGLSRHEHLPDLLQEQFHKPTGTVEYMAPEQFLRIRSDRRSDLFALGAIIYQMATGQLPFGKPKHMALVRQRVWRDPIPPRAINSGVTPALQEVILKCIEPLPDRRYDTAEELAFDLRHLDLVELTERADRKQRADATTTFGRWLRARSTMREIQSSATKPQPRAPIILVAVDLQTGSEELQQALLDSTVSVLANIPGARIACLNVMQTSLLAMDENVDSKGENIHVERLAMLRRWAEPLHLPRAKITYHLLEQRSIAAGIIDFARSNSVDHLIIGAPVGSGVTSSRLPAQVMADAPCTVTVVRPSPNAAAATT